MAGDKERVMQTCAEVFDANPTVARAAAEVAWDAAIEAAATIAEHPYRIDAIDGTTKPTETGEAIAIEIRYLKGEKRDDRG